MMILTGFDNFYYKKLFKKKKRLWAGKKKLPHSLFLIRKLHF